ncbi:hypothetical protein TIFTF001_035104 [Ficus carica]|uniref:Reverse transcriptase/retrotransposon-derived protein RNase H-like domain-containing protein n=1 Tax=Ficus carica TaxID=3494 RepID=A0AA88J9T5_FICCA|nr:hypothetical protein TIFTF001_035104 [Ficus carica]
MDEGGNQDFQDLDRITEHPSTSTSEGCPSAMQAHTDGDPHGEPGEEPSRVRSRSRHTRITRSRAVEPPAIARDYPDNHLREIVNVRGSTTSVFDSLGRPGIYRRRRATTGAGWTTSNGSLTSSRIQDAVRSVLRRFYGCGREPRELPSTHADLERQRGCPLQVLLPDPNRSCPAVVSEASSWIDRLLQITGGLLRSCIPGFKDQEARSVPPVESCTDDTLIQTFREGVKDTRLVWTLAYDKPPTFAHLRGIAWRHAEADEYVRGRGLEAREQPWLSGRKTPAGRFCQYTPLVTTIERVLNQVSGQGLLRDPPPIRAYRARRNQNKYCNFHKDVGHDTKDYIQLRDQIELLIRDGHLREFVERIITPIGSSGRAAPVARQNPRPSSRTDEPKQEHIVHTIFGGIATRDTASSRRSYAREARRYVRGEYINMAEHISKICHQDSTPITFTDDEADQLLHPHNDALIEEIRVVDNVIRRVLVDNGSLADIIFIDVFSRLRIEGAVLTPAQTPLYGFAGECIRATGTVHLLVTIGDGTERVTRMVEFIVVDQPSIYNVILGRPTLNALKADSPAASDPSSERWRLFIDGSSNSGGAGAGLVLVNPDQYKTSQALHFNFKASNNEVVLRPSLDLRIEESYPNMN